MTNPHSLSGWITIPAPPIFDPTNVCIVEEYVPPSEWIKAISLYTSTVSGSQDYYDCCTYAFGEMGELIESSLLSNLTTMAITWVDYIVQHPQLHVLLYSDVIAVEFGLQSLFWRMHLQFKTDQMATLTTLRQIYEDTPHQSSIEHTLHHYSGILQGLT